MHNERDSCNNMNNSKIRKATIEDVPEITHIYNHAILNTTATFDIQPKTRQDRLEWFEKHGDGSPLLVGEIDGKVAGWADYRPFGTRAAYRFTVENAVYVDDNYRGRGVGMALMNEILKIAVDKGFHAIVALIVQGNEASERLHSKLGFELVGTMHEVGYKFDQWLDVLIYEKIL